MSELTTQPRLLGLSGLLIAIMLVAAATAGGFGWTLRDQSGSHPTIATAPPNPAQNPPTTVAQVQSQDEIARSLGELRQQIKDLDDARQDLSQQLEATKQQLSETQEDLKLLSQLFGPLSERVDSLSASMPNGADAGQKKKAKSR